MLAEAASAVPLTLAPPPAVPAWMPALAGIQAVVIWVIAPPVY